MEKKLLYILLLLIVNFSIYSQSNYKSGYVQVSEYDTIFGLVNYKSDKSNSLICYYKKNENDTPQKFIAENIFGYRFIDSKYYISKEIETQKGVKIVFVEYLLKGAINLYFYHDAYGNHYLMESEVLPVREISYVDNIIQIDGKEYRRDCLIKKSIIRYYLKDCPEIISDINKIRIPTHKDLIELLEKYHDIKCPDGICVVYKKILPKFRIDVQPTIGMTKVNSELFLGDVAKSDYTIQFGFLTYIWMPLTNERIFFKSGVLYSKIKILDKTIYGIADTSYTFSNYNSFKIPLQFQYVFLKNRISPTFGAGINIMSNNKMKFSIYPAINLGVNVRIGNKLYVSFYSDIDYFGKYFIIPDKTTMLISNSFSIGLAIKL